MRQLIAQRYEVIQQLGAGGMGVVYEVYDRLANCTLALKQVIIDTHRLDFASKTSQGSTNSFRLALSYEFRTLASLRHPNIISVLDYGFDDDLQPYYTMQHLSGVQTITAYARDLDTDAQTHLLLELLEALKYLHRCGVLHRDLKPQNILVDSTEQVKVLDFGLALHPAESVTNLFDTGVGTIAYMAPELLVDQPASVRSDLYAVGVLAYQIFTGDFPYKQTNVGVLVQQIMTTTPDTSAVARELAAVLDRLLAKDPAARYNSAQAVIQALCSATGYCLPDEPEAVRESYLQAAKFVGRDAELDELLRALETLKEGHQGRVILVGGESGIGKSRLMDEFRIRALAKGTPVWVGQATEEQYIAYQHWRPIMRMLCLHLELTDFEASILKSLVPDIASIIGRDVADATPLDPKATQNRLLSVMVTVLRKLKQPVVVIFEDLHWVRDFPILNHLTALLPELPILFVVTYRSDERPQLADEIAHQQVIPLTRFDKAIITRLSTVMLGEATSTPELVEALHRDSEGNVFFMVEMVRELARMSGGLGNVSAPVLRGDLLPSGIKQIVERRLATLSPAAQLVLYHAALIGRQLDMDLLKALFPDQDLEAWIDQCAFAAILDRINHVWSFQHDKIRAATAAKVADEKRPAYHLRIASALEALRGETPITTPALAWHFSRAGIADKAVQYYQRAARVARSTFSNTAAVAYYREALALLERLAADDAARWQPALADVHEALGQVLALLGNVADSVHSYEAARALVPMGDVVRQARLWREQGDALMNIRDPITAGEAHQQAQAILGQHPPAPDAADWWAEWIEQRLSKMWHVYAYQQHDKLAQLISELEPHIAITATPAQRSTFFERRIGTHLLSARYWMLPDEAVAFAEASVVHAEASQSKPTIDRAKLVRSFVHLWRCELDEALAGYLEAMPSIEQVGDIDNRILAKTYLALTYRNMACLEQAQSTACEARALTESAQSWMYMGQALGNLAWVAFRTNNLPDASSYVNRAFQAWQRFPIEIPLLFVAAAPAMAVAYHLGDLAEAVRFIQMMLKPNQRRFPDYLEQPLTQAVAAFECGDFDAVEAAINRAMPVLAEPPFCYV